ncbi:MAG TPA: 3-hydroxyacyl-CoA dehydrogenase NAD-binding domain-containing protein [Solirubrobacterales bacterium]|nr:3-hydroxyacyl-CoA dehydrogenase NAD-binding domain-containing protein [Solirubrobacterales bacterium]
MGVVGSGTMGAGIAQIAAQGGMEAVLHDSDGAALEAGLERARAGLERSAEKGRLSGEAAASAIARLRAAPGMEALGGCRLVIEAAPERLDLKRELFAGLEAICDPGAVLATNTSSLSVTAIAAEAERPERIVGMHFFNPPPAMKLVEIVAGDESSEDALAAATEAGEAMGRTPIRARDAIGFVANRCARPFTLESLRMLGEGVAEHEEIDRVCRIGGGFRMGPFELMDLIGVEVNFAVAQSFWEQSFGEPRWRPHPLQQRMVASGRLGRKTGRGFYDYGGDGPHRAPDPELEAERPIFDEDELEAAAGPRAPEILGRIGAQIANEACFALGEGVASAEDIDTAMKLGFNWPLGPLAWGERLGWSRALGTLEELRELHGDGYRAARLLRERAGA